MPVTTKVNASLTFGCIEEKGISIGNETPAVAYDAAQHAGTEIQICCFVSV